MSDIDDVDFTESTQNDSGSYQYPTEPPGTPPSPFKSPTIVSSPDRTDRKHHRSVSEQVFSKAGLHGNGSKGYIRARLLKRNAFEKSPDFNVEQEMDIDSANEKYSGRSGMGGYGTGWEFGNRPGPSALYSDFSPFERTEGTSAQTRSTSGRPFSGEHFKQALKKTVKKALNSSRTDLEETTESSLNRNSISTRDSRHRHMRFPAERRRRRASVCAEYTEGRKRSFRSTADDNSVSMNSDGQLDDYQLKPSKIHGSLADLISRVKRSRSGPIMQELQIIEKHKVRSDKLIGRAYIYLHRDEVGCSHEAPIKYFSLRKGSTQLLGILYVDTIVEIGFLMDFDDSTISGAPDELELFDEMSSPATNRSYTKKSQIPKKVALKLMSHVHRAHLHRSKNRYSTQGSKETSFQSAIRIEGKFAFSPYEVTRQYLEGNDAIPNASVPWRPFLEWPGHRYLQPPMMAFQRQYSTHFWELRIPKILWPIEFLLPMGRLAFPTANLVDNLDVGDMVKITKIVESGVVNIYLVGARGLRPIPQVEMTSEKVDEKSASSMSTVGGTMSAGSTLGGSTISGSDYIVSDLSASDAGVNTVSPETRAASLVALHWAAKSLTLQPSSQIEFIYGNERKSSCMIKNNSNPDFLEEFEFEVRNGCPRCIRIMVYDRETQAGNSGVQRNSIIGEGVIDLTTLPLEVTQKMELQLLRNSNEARLLMFVTITGLTTADSVPLQALPQVNSTILPSSMASSSYSQPTNNSFDECGGDSQNGRTDVENKSDLPNLPHNFLHIVKDHFSFKESFKNSQDIGWMRLKICSAMGLGGRSTNGRTEIFCAVDMFNVHLQTQSLVKHKNLTWNRCFVIPLSDIHGIMRITVVEVEKNKSEIIGGLAIHPLRVDNGGSKWYALKTPDLRGPTKGSILLEVNVFFNQFKAALKSFSPMELPYRSLAMKQNEFWKDYLRLLQQRFEHLKPALELIRWFGRTLEDWWEWKNPIYSILGLIGYELLVYHFKPYFIPLSMIIVLMKNRIYNRESTDSIILGLKHIKNAAQLASPQEHELYKHQYGILEQSARLSEPIPGDEGNDFDWFDFEEALLENPKRSSHAALQPHSIHLVEKESDAKYLQMARDFEGPKFFRLI
ncbi:hypothetical protein Aperf_G00000071504 [Anoplocephala perfoliata]